MLSRVFCFIAAVLMAGPLAVAGELDRGHVSQDAVWLAHLDIAELNTNPNVDFVRGVWLDNADVQQKIREVRQAIGVDLVNGIGGITLYNWNLKEGQGVVLIHAQLDADKAAGMVADKPDYATVQHGNHKLHTWTDENDKTVVAAYHGKGILLFAHSQDAAKKALDVIDGTKPSLASGEGAIEAKLPARTIFYAEAIDLNKARDNRLASKARSAQVVVRQDDATIHFDTTVLAVDEKSAQEFANALALLKAFILTQARQNPTAAEAVDLIESVGIEQKGTLVTIRAKLPNKLIAEKVKAGVEKWKAQQEGGI